MRRRVVQAVVVLLLVVPGPLTALAPRASAQIALTRVAGGLAWPVWVAAPPGDARRLFIVQQGGLIRILKDGALLAAPFLDVSALVTPELGQGSEQGLLGLAFDPQYAVNGRFFIDYTDVAGNTLIARYVVSAADPDRADPASAVTLLAIDQPFANHNGGTVAFGPRDGYLYVGMGDGGSAGDPGNRAQDGGTLLGKLLRLDVSGAAYAIPPDNPFAAPGGARDEIWAVGLRNPYRFSFDPLNGDLYIGDVGQDAWEEVDWQPGDAPGGRNYGWRRMEGTHCYDPVNDCNDGSLILPVYEYSHDGGCSVTGGAVYRGAAIPAVQGTYFFADYCTPRLRSFRMTGGALADFREWPLSVVPGAGTATVGAIAAIAPDGVGELYIVDRTGTQEGELWKIVPEGTPAVERRTLGATKALYRGR